MKTLPVFKVTIKNDSKTGFSKRQVEKLYRQIHGPKAIIDVEEVPE